MSFDLTILGSSSALPTSKRFPTAQLLQVDERFFLIDCGEGTQIQLRKFGYNPARIHHIFISHLHGDHVFGLFGLLSTMGMMGRKAQLNLYGPRRLQDIMESHMEFFGPLPFGLSYNSPEQKKGGGIFKDEKLTVTAIALKHRTETYGYLFRERKKLLNVRKDQIRKFKLGIADMVKIKRGEDFITETGEVIQNRILTLPPYNRRSFAYISDTLYDPGLADEIGGVNLLFHEATFSMEDEKLAEKTLHSTAAQAANIASLAGAQRLLIGHFSSRYKDHGRLVKEAREIFSNTEGVEDGDTYSVPQERLSTE